MMESHSNSISSRLSCFFCSRSNSRKYLNPQDFESDCYGNAEETVSSFHEFSLRNLYRFLNLLHSDKEEKDFKDLKMPICEDCVRLNGEFNKLYNLVEETKLRLNWCIRKMQDVIIKAGKEDKMIGMKEEGHNLDQKTLKFGIWRTHTLDRMKAYARSSFPRVLLCKNECKRQLPWIKDEEKVSEMKMVDEDVIMDVSKADAMDKGKMLKTSTFAINSNGILACFLCLRSNSRNPRYETDFGENAEEVLSDFHEFSLRNLYRFLNSFQSEKEENEEMDFSDLKMPICEECFRLNGEFDKLFNLLEETELRLNWCIKKLEDVMMTGAKCESRLSLFQVELMEDEVDEETILEIWRTHTLERMKIVTSSASFPPILLHKNKRKLLSSFGSELVDLVKKERTSQVQAEDEDEKFMFVAITGDEIIDQVKTLSVYQPHVKEEDVKKVYHEEFRFPSSVVGETQVSTEDHEVKIKMECETKVEESYRENLERCLALKVKNKILRRRPAFMSKRNKRSTKCINYVKHNKQLFDSGKAGDDPYRVRDPAFSENVQLDIQMECDVSETYMQQERHLRPYFKAGGRGRPAFMSNFIPVGNDRGKLRCKSCKIILNRSEAFDHFKRDCGDDLWQPFLSKKGKHSNKCSYCSYKSSSPVGSPSALGSMVNHLVRFHPEHYLINEKEKAEGLWHENFRAILEDTIYPNFILNEGHHRSCKLCEKIFKYNYASRNMFMLTRHLLFNHVIELKEKFKIILEDPRMEEKLDILKPKPIKQPRRILKREMKMKYSYSSDCAYCCYKTVSPAGTPSSMGSMVSHIVRFHPEHYLINKKDKAEGLWHEQFLKILTNMVYPNCIQKMELHRRSCTLCGRIFEDTPILEKHLLFFHKSELKGKFKDILEDPLLEERLKTFNSWIRVSKPRARNNFKDKKKTHTSDCSYCGYKTTSHPQPQPHLTGIQKAPEGLLRPRPIPSEAEEILVSDCPYCVFNCGVKDWRKRQAIKDHLMGFHPEHFLFDENEMDKVLGIRPEQYQTILIEIIFPKFTKKTEQDEQGHATSCGLCDTEYRTNVLQQNVHSLRSHLVFHHNYKLKKEFRIITQDVLFGECLNSSTCTTETGAPGTQLSYKCPYCRFKCAHTHPKSSMSLERHLVRFHPHHYFLGDGDEKPNLELITFAHPHFQRILTEIVFPKFVVIFGQQTKCSLCNMKYTVGQKGYENIVFARKHLMLEHKTELIKSIKVVLEGKLDGSIPGGVTCTCGAYFSREETPVLNYHKKIHCVHIDEQQNTEKFQDLKNAHCTF